jgi:hypothetical protein
MLPRFLRPAFPRGERTGAGSRNRFGETFNLIGYKSLDPLSFGFSSVDITGLAAGFDYVITPVGTGGTNFQLTALNNGVSTTPEPSTWALVLASISLIAFKARRMCQTT